MATKKKPVETYEPEHIIGAEEKVEDDPLVATAAEEDDSAEEIGIDGEELDLFADRWEE